MADDAPPAKKRSSTARTNLTAAWYPNEDQEAHRTAKVLALGEAALRVALISVSPDPVTIDAAAAWCRAAAAAQDAAITAHLAARYGPRPKT